MRLVTDWDKYPDFTKEEMVCKHCGACYMDVRLMDILQDIRTTYGKPMIVTSGYRCVSHPVEVKKRKGGEHTLGLAVDIRCDGTEAYKLLKLAMAYGVKRIGVSQSNGAEFLHFGMADGEDGFLSPHVWSY